MSFFFIMSVNVQEDHIYLAMPFFLAICYGILNLTSLFNNTR